MDSPGTTLDWKGQTHNQLSDQLHAECREKGTGEEVHRYFVQQHPLLVDQSMVEGNKKEGKKPR